MLRQFTVRVWCCLLVLGFTCLVAGCGSIQWRHDYQQGVRQAAQNRQRVLLEFTAGFDRDASQMDKEVFSDPAVQDVMKRFVPVRLDAGLNRELAEQLGVQKTPAFFVLRPDTTVAGSVQGVVTADRFRYFLIVNSLN